ncbi:MAG: hypothetical protein PHR83_06490 [Paludibacter sp.]|nr:hypothetical protein [Paludibacter sp.]
MKWLLVVLFWLSIANGFAQSSGYSHWSMTLEAGTVSFNGDIIDTQTSISDRLTHPSIGATVDYTIFPFLSMGLVYNHGYIQANNGTDSFVNNMNTFYPYLGLNLLNLLFEKNKSGFGLWTHIGFGIAGYQFADRVNPDRITQGGVEYYIKSEAPFHSYILPFGLTLDYNISNKLAIGVRVERFKYFRDNLEGINQFNYRGTSNDFTNSAMLQLRYKFCTKDSRNMRDCTWNDVF